MINAINDAAEMGCQKINDPSCMMLATGRAAAVSSQAVVSYLIIGIPMLAYSLASRLVNFGSAIMGGMQGLQSASLRGNASAAAAAGNTSMGNVTMDQRVVSPSTSSP